VKIGLKPFKRAAAGVITLRLGGRQVGRRAYRAKPRARR
jgi:hypothetical protein